MMKVKRSVLGLVIGGLTLVAVPGAWAQKAAQPEHKEKSDKQASTTTAKIGEQAPGFTLTDTAGKTVKLEDYKGKIVVLDWFNPECPVCKGHYEKKTIQNLASKFESKNVVFLAINSGGAGQQGHGKDKNATAKKDWGINFPILLDESGKVGRTYGAKTTPHCFVIDTKGTLVYAGAIDDGAKGKATVNYVEKAVNEVLKGESVSTPKTDSFGCNVKYGKGT